MMRSCTCRSSRAAWAMVLTVTASWQEKASIAWWMKMQYAALLDLQGPRGVCAVVRAKLAAAVVSVVHNLMDSQAMGLGAGTRLSRQLGDYR